MSWVIRNTNEVFASGAVLPSVHRGEKIQVRGRWYKVKRVKHYVYEASTTSVAYVRKVPW